MGKFKVGDCVRVTEPVGLGRKVEVTGKIIRVLEGIAKYSVEFDEDIHGHDCGGQCDGIKGEYGYCWNCKENWLQLVSANSSIHIYSDGTTTTAILKDGKETIRTAQAKCSPDDTYDFNVGTKLAFDRLMENEVKEVKRKANVGEWVKVVNPTSDTANEYKKTIFYK